MRSLVLVSAFGLLLSACGQSSSNGPIAIADDICGDGELGRTEECDDGNTDADDGCSSSCAEERGFLCSGSSCSALCGDGIVTGEEVCDGTDGGTYCSDDCSEVVGSCGDGLVQPEFGEVCDTPQPHLGDSGHSSGMGGATATTSYSQGEAGCDHDCLPRRGFTCDEDTNTCQQTGVARDELIDDHYPEFCQLVIGMLGGAGEVHRCTLRGAPYDITVATVSECTSNFHEDPYGDHCTIGEMEDWLVDRSACSFFADASPCD